MKTTLIANGTKDQLVLVPETDLEKAFMRQLGETKVSATVERLEYKPVGGGPAAESSIVITIPHGSAETAKPTQRADA